MAAEVLELARQHGPEALIRIVSLMRSKNDAVAFRAAEAILDRAYGRPPQAIALENQRPVQIIIGDAQKPEMKQSMPTAIPSDSVERRPIKKVVIS